MEDTVVFIDGEYLSKIAKHFFNNNPPAYDIRKFAFTLARKQDLWCADVFYYTAPPYQDPTPTEEQMRRRANYDRFIGRLKSSPKFQVMEGRCQKLDDGYHQKGVDTLITMDLMTIALMDKVKTITLLTCDTDFVPVLNRIRENLKVKVILYYYSDFVRKSNFSMSNHILTACDKCVLLDKTYFGKSVLL